MTDTDDEAATGIDDSAALSDAVADEHATALAEAAAISSIGASSSTRTRRDAPRRGPYHLALPTTAPPYASPAGPLATYRAGVAK
ncbi:hypothetical protein ACWDUD_25535 [Rhodococcus sp. NPDC003382]|uniref:hypothetical protein n=1 Tax=Rhodococcus sp. HM1 TaxID=2937759 RepID=UPI00200B9A54|nr:hypothetical protein [Rhodococcus sp. HM1]MCK8674537.1 hypothetical protein [Rhodococcus sp. HM1]